jgi:hypothetical protein
LFLVSVLASVAGLFLLTAFRNHVDARTHG